MLEFSYLQIFLLFPLGYGLSKAIGGIGTYLKNYNIHKSEVTRNGEVKYIGQIKFSFVWSVWLGVYFLGVFQWFVAQYLNANKMIEYPVLILTTLLTAFVLAVISHILIPDFNASDVQEKLKEDNYALSDFFLRHRKKTGYLLALLIMTLAINYPFFWGKTWGDYFIEMFPIHCLLFLFCIVMVSLKSPQEKYPFINISELKNGTEENLMQVTAYKRYATIFWSIHSVISVVSLIILFFRTIDIFQELPLLMALLQ